MLRKTDAGPQDGPPRPPGAANALAVAAVALYAALRDARGGAPGRPAAQRENALLRKPAPAPAQKGAPPQPARHPAEIPAAGWKSILRRTWDGFNSDRIMLVAAGIAFYLLLSIFPAISAFVSLYGFVADRSTIAARVDVLHGVLPEGGVELLQQETTRIAAAGQSGLSLVFLFGLAVSLWSANNGMKGLFEGMNVVYEQPEKRSFVRLNLQSLGFTFAAMIFAMIALGAIVAAPIALNFVGFASMTATIIALGRWPLLYFGLVLALAVLYRYGPSREPAAPWRWITWGSATASALFLVVSILFSWYVANFGHYNATYGSLGAAIGFMTWIWLSITVVLLGGELNSQIERQAGRRREPD